MLVYFFTDTFLCSDYPIVLSTLTDNYHLPGNKKRSILMSNSTTLEQESSEAAMIHYRHQQWGIEMVALLTVCALVAVLVAPYLPAPTYWAHGAAVCFLLVAWLFSSLTITIEDEQLAWHFGPGLISFKVMLDDIRSAQSVRVRWYRSWGMAPTSRGWLYSVSGRRAVLLKMTDGRHLLIGSDEPDALVKVLLQHFSCR